MSTAADHVLEQAMRLPPAERELVAESLAASLGECLGSDQDKAIIELLEQRRADYLAGRAETHSADDVIARARALLK